MRTFHIQRNNRRTTISLHPKIVELLTIKLGKIPDEPDSKKAVRQWLQSLVDQSTEYKNINLSQWVQGETIMFLASDELVKQWDNWQKQII